VKYLLLIYHNPEARQLWESFTEDQKAEGLALYAALNNDLAASGELIVAEALESPASASRVSVTDGRTVAGDGPYVETKEHLAGFYLVDVASRERAIEIAGRIPEAAIGGVEVRPVLTYSALEM
jgi:hypothetical protein